MHTAEKDRNGQKASDGDSGSEAGDAGSNAIAECRDPINAVEDAGGAGHVQAHGHGQAAVQAGGHLQQGGGVGVRIVQDGDGPVVAGVLAGTGQPAPGQVDQGMVPVERRREEAQQVIEGVPSPDVGEFVDEDAVEGLRRVLLHQPGRDHDQGAPDADDGGDADAVGEAQVHRGLHAKAVAPVVQARHLRRAGEGRDASAQAVCAPQADPDPQEREEQACQVDGGRHLEPRRERGVDLRRP